MSGNATRDRDELARACADQMWRSDRASRALGMRIEEIRAGYARLSMPVHLDMLNGHATCHGGFIFTLADSAFAFACNYRNRVTVASGAQVTFVAPAREGDVLIASAEELSRAGRTGVYDIRVEKQDGALVALFRGNAYQLDAPLLPEVEVDGVRPSEIPTNRGGDGENVGN